MSKKQLQSETQALPLDGITVISVEQAVSVPLATRHLADMGARVIKVERPDTGDFARHYDAKVVGESAYFVWCNRSKESLTLDLKHPQAGKIMGRLLAEADVFIQNLAPGAADRLGLSAACLRKDFPRLIVCGLSGYGEDGPYRDRKAYDLLLQAEGGVLSVTGTPEQPCKVGVSIADIAAAMYCYSNILAALYARERDGAGRAIEMSMLEAIAEWVGHPLYTARYGGHPPPRAGARHASIAPYGPFTTVDGHTVMIGLQNEREWVRFTSQVLAQPELARDPRFEGNAQRVANLDALDALIRARIEQLTHAEACELLEQARIAYAEVRDMHGVAAHPQLAARERWQEVGLPKGETFEALLPPGRLEGVCPRMAPVPALGEHTESILTSLGYPAATIAAWRRDGVI